jgi:hypothetical protein
MWLARLIAGPLIRREVQQAFSDGRCERCRDDASDERDRVLIEHANARNAYLGGFADGVRAAIQEPGEHTKTPHAPPGITREMISNAYSVADGRPGARIPWVDLDPLPQDIANGEARVLERL